MHAHAPGLLRASPLLSSCPSRAAQFGIVDPVEREQRALHAPQLAQGRGEAVLLRI